MKKLNIAIIVVTMLTMMFFTVETIVAGPGYSNEKEKTVTSTTPAKTAKAATASNYQKQLKYNANITNCEQLENALQWVRVYFVDKFSSYENDMWEIFQLLVKAHVYQSSVRCPVPFPKSVVAGDQAINMTYQGLKDLYQIRF